MNPLLITFAVYISIFLFGMTLMRTGLLYLGKERANVWIEAATSQPWKSLLIGTAASAILQSSSAVLIMTVALVAAKQLRFTSAVGIVLGANIGTTLTLEILAFHIDVIAIPLVIIGALCLFTGKKKWMFAGTLTFGLGCMLIAMHGFESLSGAMIGFVNRVLETTNATEWQSFLVGNLFTIIIQSSSGALAIVMTMLEQNALLMTLALAFMLGSNVGTCATAFLASIGAGKAAFYVALSHLAVNLLGTLLFYPLLPWFSEWTQMLSNHPAQQLAHASVIYNIVTSVVCLPLLLPLAKRIEKAL
ncbi:Na/Pi symporter [Aureibacillus halotolerans]|uniref:Phosphate:Na+ symporter n=1 Tax=Aureibacillus halotolerans TaxID=1508390 RepID=A0A4R6U186_9BACI|nr:Na/Pi symporter [Aureibacillus halotolerans]TDQ38055.1 phosphate:Na+ symporter [Aureibacillus halotolerans]